jgi:prepilin-type N-terminal cleavage/methylation domain-containing protein
MTPTLATGRENRARSLVKRRTETGSRPAAEWRSAFTLVEIVIVLTVVGILAGISVPTITGVIREREARQPVSELLRMARTVRQLAISQQEPYQIAFDGQGFHAARFFNPYGESEEFAQVLRDMEELERRRKLVEASRERMGELSSALGGESPEASAEQQDDEKIFYQSYELPDGVDYDLLFWGQTEWISMQGGRFERWVFQPSGMCLPIKIRVRSDNAFFEVEFHPMTANVKSERGWVE